MSKGYIFYKVE